MTVHQFIALCMFGVAAHPCAGAPGDVDSGFNPDANNEVFALAMQPDGKIVAGGTFTLVSGTSRPYFARLHPGGTLDAGFNPATNGQVQSTGVLKDHRILLTGVFTRVSGVDRIRIARVNAAGIPDAGFIPTADSDVRSLTFLNGDSVLFGGLFTSVNGTPRSYLARLDANANLDPAFNPAPDGPVRITALQPDGKVIFGGQFSSVGGFGRNRVARMNADGTLDPGFNPNVGGSAVYCMALQPDRKIVIGGTFTTVGGVPRLNIARLNADGTLDAGFNPGANDIVRCAAMQTDGRIVITGNFTVVGGNVRYHVARLNAAGTADISFDPNANNNVYGAVLQADGKIVVGGLFDTVGGVPRNAIARLENNPATQSLTVSGPDRVQWLRGGTSPEAQHVTFELSIDGGETWSFLGDGTRISGGWELTGLALPAAGRIRAQARVTGGYANASSGLLETATTFVFSSQEMWRGNHFGTIDNSGDAADTADPDKDGLENLIEFAFGLDPNKADVVALPAWEASKGNLSLTFDRPADVSGITYFAEYSTNLAAGSWVTIPNSAFPPHYTFLAPSGIGERVYLRLRITVP